MLYILWFLFFKNFIRIKRDYINDFGKLEYYINVSDCYYFGISKGFCFKILR